MARITRKNVESYFQFWAEEMGFDIVAGDGKKYFALDYYAPGGNKYVWKIVQIDRTKQYENGSYGWVEYNPLGFDRMTSDAILDAMRLCIRVKDYKASNG